MVKDVHIQEKYQELVKAHIRYTQAIRNVNAVAQAHDMPFADEIVKLDKLSVISLYNFLLETLDMVYSTRLQDRQRQEPRRARDKRNLTFTSDPKNFMFGLGIRAVSDNPLPFPEVQRELNFLNKIKSQVISFRNYLIREDKKRGSRQELNVRSVSGVDRQLKTAKRRKSATLFWFKRNNPTFVDADAYRTFDPGHFKGSMD